MPNSCQHIAAPESVNMDAKKLAGVIQHFQKQQANHVFPGGQLVIKRHGKVVVNLAIGLATGYRENEELKVPVTPQTIFPIYSCCQPLASIAIALLDHRVLLDIRAPIAEVIPEFATDDKNKISTLDVLTHCAGLVVPELTLKHKKESHEFAMGRLIEAKPAYRRGTFCYTSFEFGTLLCEITRRVTGKPLAHFLVDEIAIPLGLDSLRYGLDGRDKTLLAHTYWFGKPSTKQFGQRVPSNFEELNNEAPLCGSLNPGFSMITTASDLASFYDFLLAGGVTPSGKAILSPEIIQQYTQQSLCRWNRVFKVFLPMGRGFFTGNFITTTIYGLFNTHGCFGHAGAYCSLAYADKKKQLSVAILTNGYRGQRDFVKRFLLFNQQLRNACR